MRCILYENQVCWFQEARFFLRIGPKCAESSDSDVFYGFKLKNADLCVWEVRVFRFLKRNSRDTEFALSDIAVLVLRVVGVLSAIRGLAKQLLTA